ncbi:WD repeat-containing protein 6 [Geranomyces variabilis]|nr:WD repeat-containing protein 6 [Geranomyces variabilis]
MKGSPGRALTKTAYAGQITALEFLTPSILLATTGPFAKVFDVLAGRTIAVFEIFESTRVHGIHPDRAPLAEPGAALQSVRVAFSGGKQLKVLRLTFEYDAAGTLMHCEQAIASPLNMFKDWIKDVAWLKSGESERLALAFAHNFVEIWDVPSGTFIEKIQCEEHCILYSARFFGGDGGKTYLASGTVFNQILLWDIESRNQEGEGVIHKSLVGHEGVIFNIRVSHDGKRLATASDDRTIRVWETAIDRKSQHICLYGHASRVWDCKIVGKLVVSVAEDSTCRVWDLDSSECIACWEGHAGKNVWSVDIDPLANVVASGGGDAGIRLWSLTSLERNKIDSDEQFSRVEFKRVQDIVKSAEIVRTFAIVDFTRSIIATTEGRFLLCERADPGQELYADAEFSRYGVLATSECCQLSVVGGIDGQVAAFSPLGAFSPVKWSAHSTKITLVVIRPAAAPGTWYLITGSETVDVLHMSVVRIPDSPALPCVIEMFATVVLPIHFWTMDVTLCVEQHLLILGSRAGAIATYEFSNAAPDDGTTAEPAILEADILRRRAHGKEAVTSIAVDPRMSADRPGELTFGTVGRDGVYCRWAMKRTQEAQAWTMDLFYRSKITNGWLEKIQYADDTAVICGFFAKCFFAYNETKKYEMFSVACGGGHRKWEFKAQDGLLNRATFGFLRKEKLHFVFRETDTSKQFSEPKLQDGHSGSETRVVRFVDGWEASEKSLFVTSGEDAVLRFSEYDPKRQDQTFRNLVNIRKHISVIRGIAFTRGKGGMLMFTAGAHEELRCWRLERDAQQGVRCLDTAIAPNASDITETRIMDIGAASLASLGEDFATKHLIAAACSDTFVRLWLFDEERNDFSLLGYSRAHGRCVLKARVTLVRSPKQVEVVVTTAGTDGRILLWDCEILARRSGELQPLELGTPMHSSTLHQSGVNALDVTTSTTDAGESSFCIATGGDDNAIAAMSVTLKRNESGLSVANLVQGIMPSPYSSGVTGIKFIRPRTIITTSSDQRINVFDLVQHQPEDGVYDFSCVSSVYIEVADIADLDVKKLEGDRFQVAVGGFGIQILDSEAVPRNYLEYL